MMNNEAGKGDLPRPCFITAEALQLNYDLAFGKIKTQDYYTKRAILEAQGKWWK